MVQQLGVVSHLMPAHVVRHEGAGEVTVPGHSRQDRLHIVERVGLVDVALAGATGLAVGEPESPHEVVEGHAVVRPRSQRQVQREADRRAERVVRDDAVRPVRSIDGSASVDKRCHLAHLRRRADVVRGTPAQGLDQARQPEERGVQVAESCTVHHEGFDIARETLCQPEAVGHVRMVEIEGLDALRPNAFDVPAVEELVGDCPQRLLTLSRIREGPALGDAGAVPMLHAVAIGPGQVVGEEGVVPRLIGGELAEDGAFLLHDFLHVAEKRRHCDVWRFVVQRESEGPAAGGERVERPDTDFRRAVHQVLQVRGGEHERIGGGVQLGRHGPGRSGRWPEHHLERPLLQPAREHDGGRHVDVSVGGVDGQVGAVESVTENPVTHHDLWAVGLNSPPGRVRVQHRQRMPGPVVGLDVVDVLGEVVGRVSTG